MSPLGSRNPAINCVRIDAAGVCVCAGSERLQRSGAKAETDRETEISRDSGLMCV